MVCWSSLRSFLNVSLSWFRVFISPLSSWMDIFSWFLIWSSCSLSCSVSLVVKAWTCSLSSTISSSSSAKLCCSWSTVLCSPVLGGRLMFSVVSGVVLFFLLLWVEGSFWSVSSGVSEWFCSQGFASSLSTISFKHWKVCSKFVRAALFPCIITVPFW